MTCLFCKSPLVRMLYQAMNGRYIWECVRKHLIAMKDNEFQII